MLFFLRAVETIGQIKWQLTCQTPAPRCRYADAICQTYSPGSSSHPVKEFKPTTTASCHPAVGRPTEPATASDPDNPAAKGAGTRIPRVRPRSDTTCTRKLVVTLRPAAVLMTAAFPRTTAPPATRKASAWTAPTRRPARVSIRLVDDSWVPPLVTPHVRSGVGSLYAAGVRTARLER